MTNTNTKSDNICVNRPRHYDVIYADPPWPGMSGEPHYETMTLDRIAGMSDAVRSVAADDSWLFMWTTRALMDPAKLVMAAWGWQYRDHIWWGKLNKFGFGDPRVGIRRASEVLLVGTRGKVVPQSRNTPDYFIAPVSSRHSEKPHHGYAIIDNLAGMDVRRLELFARHRQPGWDVWGNDPAIQSDVSFAAFGYPVPSDEPQPAPDGGQS